MQSDTVQKELVKTPKSNLRYLKEADQKFIYSLFLQSRHLSGAFYWSWTNYWTKRGAHNWMIYEVEGVSAGTIHWHLSKKFGMNVIEEIAVHEKFKRKGIGKALLGIVKKPILLKTDKDLAESNQFYKSLGFTLVGTESTKKGKPMNVYQKW